MLAIARVSSLRTWAPQGIVGTEAAAAISCALSSSTSLTALVLDATSVWATPEDFVAVLEACGRQGQIRRLSLAVTQSKVAPPPSLALLSDFLSAPAAMRIHSLDLAGQSNIGTDPACASLLARALSFHPTTLQVLSLARCALTPAAAAAFLAALRAGASAVRLDLSGNALPLSAVPHVVAFATASAPVKAIAYAGNAASGADCAAIAAALASRPPPPGEGASALEHLLSATLRTPAGIRLDFPAFFALATASGV